MKFDIKTDVILKGAVWDNAIDKLVGPMFARQWELYVLCISIGMMYDEQIESEDMVSDDEESRYIPRNILTQPQNYSLIELMLQSALITTSHLDLTEDERLELAFGEESELDFKPIAFLTKFANSGIMKLNPLISDSDITETMDSFTTFLQELYKKGANVINDPLDFDDFEEG